MKLHDTTCSAKCPFGKMFEYLPNYPLIINIKYKLSHYFDSCHIRLIYFAEYLSRNVFYPFLLSRFDSSYCLYQVWITSLYFSQLTLCSIRHRLANNHYHFSMTFSNSYNMMRCSAFLGY